MTWESEIKKLNQCPQRQDSLTEQMKDLHTVAIKLGCYDAADYLKREFVEKK